MSLAVCRDTRCLLLGRSLKRRDPSLKDSFSPSFERTVLFAFTSSSGVFRIPDPRSNVPPLLRLLLTAIASDLTSENSHQADSARFLVVPPYHSVGVPMFVCVWCRKLLSLGPESEGRRLGVVECRQPETLEHINEDVGFRTVSCRFVLGKEDVGGTSLPSTGPRSVDGSICIISHFKVRTVPVSV